MFFSLKKQVGNVLAPVVVGALGLLILLPILTLAVKRGGQTARSQAIFPHEVSFSEINTSYDSGANAFTITGKLCFNSGLGTGSETLRLWANSGTIQGGTSDATTISHTVGIGEFLCEVNRYWDFTIGAVMTDVWKSNNCPDTQFTLGLNSNRRGRLDPPHPLSISHPNSCVIPAPTAIPTSGQISPSVFPTLVPLACPWPKPDDGANHPPDCFFKSIPQIASAINPVFPPGDSFSVSSDYRFHFPWRRPPVLDMLDSLPPEVKARIPANRPLLREYRWTVYMQKPGETAVTNCFATSAGFGVRAAADSTGVDSNTLGPLPAICRISSAKFQGSVRAIYNIPDTRSEDGKFFECCRLEEVKTPWTGALVPTATIAPSATPVPSATPIPTRIPPISSPTVALPTANLCRATSLPPNRGSGGQGEINVPAIRALPGPYKLVCRRVSGSEMEIANYSAIPIPQAGFEYYHCGCPGVRADEIKCSYTNPDNRPANSDSYRYHYRNAKGPGDTDFLQPGMKTTVRLATSGRCEVSEFTFFALDANNQRIPCLTPDGRAWDGGVAFMIDNKCEAGAISEPVHDAAPDFSAVSPVAGARVSTSAVAVVDLTCDGRVTAADISVAITSYAQHIDACGQSVYMDAKAFSAMLREFSSEGE